MVPDLELTENDRRGVVARGAEAPLLGTLRPGAVRTELIAASWREWLKAAVLASVVLGLIALGFMGLIDCLVSNPNQRGWIIIGLMYYVGSIWIQAYDSLTVILWRKFYLRVVVHRTESTTLFEAITKRLEELAETRPSVSSRDVEAFTKYDSATGVNMVKFNFWGTRPHQLSFQLTSPVGAGRSRTVTVDYSFGDSMILGRDAHVERNRSMVLWLRTSKEHVVEDKLLLQHWCEECVSESMAPPPDRVEVYGLQESSADWVPEWKLERTKSLKLSGSVGERFYLERSKVNELRADASLWSQRSLRLYMVTGPPGVGKTEFTVWLAGVLRFPIYRLNLTMGSLTDARLAQLLSQSSVRHETVVVQIDEFQEVLRRWDTNDRSISVTPGGFNEVLQGSASLAKGVIVLTGTSEAASECRRKTYTALFRRFHMQIELGYLERADTICFYRRFLMEFVDNSEDDWQACETQFSACLLAHAPQHVSIDMIKQFLMRRITSACAAGLITQCKDAATFHVVPSGKIQLQQFLNCGPAMEAFFQTYATGDCLERVRRIDDICES